MFLLFNILCLFYAFLLHIFSFCFIIGSNIFQVFLYLLQFLNFQCEPGVCLGLSLLGSRLYSVSDDLAVCLIWDRGTEKGLPESSCQESWLCWLVSVLVRWSGNWSNKWQMALSGDCLSEDTLILHSGIIPFNWQPAFWKGLGKVTENSTIQRVAFHFIPFWVLLSLPGALNPEFIQREYSDFLWQGVLGAGG